MRTLLLVLVLLLVLILLASCAPSSDLAITPAHAEATRKTERVYGVTVTMPEAKAPNRK